MRRNRQRVGRRGSLTAGLGYGGLSFATNALLAVVSSIVIARLYGIRVVGEFALVSAPTAALWHLSTAREQVAFVREIASLEPRAPRITGLFWAVFAFSSGLTLVVAALAVGAVELLYRGPVDHPELIAPAIASLGAYVVVANSIWNVDMVFSAFRAGRELNAVRLHQALAFVALVAVGSSISTSVWTLVAATVVSQATSLVHRTVLIPRYMRGSVPRAELRAGFGALPAFIRFGAKVVPGDLAVGVSNETGVWVLSIARTVQEVGAYSRAWVIATRLIELNYRVTEILFPSLVERWQKGDRPGFDRALVDTLRYTAVAMLVPAGVGGGAAHGIMAVYGRGFDRAADALAVALLVPAVAILMNCQRQALLAVERPTASSVCAAAGMVVTVGASIVLTLAIGLAGTALGVLVGYFVALALASLVVRAHMSESLSVLWPRARRPAPFVAYASSFAVTRVLQDALDSVAGLLVSLPVGTAVFAAVFALLGGLTPRDRQRLGAARLRIQRFRRPPLVGET
jgi:O-antigen/teichoic acid export membrane protein